MPRWVGRTRPRHGGKLEASPFVVISKPPLRTRDGYRAVREKCLAACRTTWGASMARCHPVDPRHPRPAAAMPLVHMRVPRDRAPLAQQWKRDTDEVDRVWCGHGASGRENETRGHRRPPALGLRAQHPGPLPCGGGRNGCVPLQPSARACLRAIQCRDHACGADGTVTAMLSLPVHL